MIINTVWIAIAMRIGIPYSFYRKVKRFVSRSPKEGEPTMPKTKVDTLILKIYNKIPLEWLHLNILTTGFLIVLLYLLRHPAKPLEGLALFILVILLIVRASFDYIIGWIGVYTRRMYYEES